MRQASILVIGAGIGGLTAAIALGRRGFHVSMIERDPEWSVYGVGIIQQSNVVRAMSEGDMLALMVFAVIFGVGLAMTPGESARRLEEALRGLFEVQEGKQISDYLVYDKNWRGLAVNYSGILGQSNSDLFINLPYSSSNIAVIYSGGEIIFS